MIDTEQNIKYLIGTLAQKVSNENTTNRCSAKALFGPLKQRNGFKNLQDSDFVQCRLMGLVRKIRLNTYGRE